MPDIILETQNLKKSFGGFVAIDGINLKIERGELRTILGPNGAGKTTLYNLISGNMKPSSGKIFFKGDEITGLSPDQVARKGIGRKFQIPSIFDEMTVYENMLVPVISGRGISGMFSKPKSEETERVNSLLTVVNLLERAHMKAKYLSGGQKQWLEIGMAIANNPDLILLDEPTAGMTAPDVKATIAELIHHIVKTTTVVLIEHDMAFVRMLARRVTVLDRGKILAEGDIDDLVKNVEVVNAYLGRGR